jgi:hypothetical protein
MIIKVLTYNIWGLPNLGPIPLAPHRSTRIKGICARLSSSYQQNRLDVILIQEAWLKKDREFIKKFSGFPYSLDLDHGNLDSGLLILSRFQIDDSKRFTYPETVPKKIISLITGELFPKKSAIFARIIIDVGNQMQKKVWIGNTHLVSFYNTKVDAFSFIRKKQFKSFLITARALSQKLPLILGGDWNFNLKSNLLRMIPKFLHLKSKNPVIRLNKNSSIDRIDHLIGFNKIKKVQENTLFNDDFITIKHKFLPFFDEKVRLSDHYAWESHFTLE